MLLQSRVKVDGQLFVDSPIHVSNMKIIQKKKPLWEAERPDCNWLAFEKQPIHELHSFPFVLIGRTPKRGDGSHWEY